MSEKTLIFLGMTVGSIIGGYIPAVFGIGLFSFTSIITSALGGIAGIILVHKLINP